MTLSSKRLRVGLVLAGAVGTGLLFWLHGPKWSAVGHSLTGVSWGWASVAIGLNLTSALARALAWRTVLVQAMPRPHPGYLTVFSAFFIGVFANGVLPGRVGEVARVGVVARRMQGRRGLWPTLLGSVVAHRLLEVVPSFLLIAWVLLAAKLPAWAFGALITVLVGGSVLFVLGLLGARRHEEGEKMQLGPVRTALTTVRQGLGVLRAPRAAAYATVLQLAAWGLQLLAVWTAMLAFHLHVPFVAAGVVLALMNVALLVPLWPGNVGLQQAAIALPLVAYGVPYAHGFAYGIGLQAIESSVGYFFGLVFLAYEGLSLGGLRALPSESGGR